MRVIEVNDNDIYGKIFNGYSIMEELNKDSNFDVKQLVHNKFSDNSNVVKLFSDYNYNLYDYYLHKYERDILSSHSLLSVSTEFLKRNNYYLNSDLAHFHQVHNCRFSLPTFYELAKKKPTVISFHDPWFMTGRCVHPFECTKWKDGCKKCDKLDTLFELPHDTCADLWNIKSEIKDTDVDIIVHSEFMYNMAKENPYTKDLRIHLIPFGINFEKYNFSITKEEAKKELGILPNDKVIFFRVQDALKGSQYVVEALSGLKDKANITLLTCSKKGLIEDLKKYFNVVEVGAADENTMLKCYNASDLFLMPSLGESFGMMAVEAMASEVPTLVFDNSALPSTSGAPDYGILVKNKDSKDLREKIEYYLTHDKERIERGIKSKEFVIKKYDYDAYFNNIKSVYNEAYEKQKYKINSVIKIEKNEIEYNDNIKLINKKISIIKKKVMDYTVEDSSTGIAKFDKNAIEFITEQNKLLFKESITANKVRDIELEGEIKLKEEQLKNNEPKVSIIIPVYNGSNYVRLAIESALRQTYKNLEIIVVNDGSKDNTEEICKKYGDKIVYLPKENGGVSTALNYGVEHMTGDYFSWLSHDDLYYPEKVQEEVDYLVKNNLLGTKTILYSNYTIMDGDGNPYSDVVFNTYDLNKFGDFSLLKMAINGLSLLIPKKAFEESGGFDPNLRCVQDYELWLRMMRDGYNFVHIPKSLVVTRLHSLSVTSTSPKVRTEGNAFWLELIKSYNKNDIKKMYGSEYCFYNSLYSLFDKGPYDEAIAYCKDQMEKIEKNNKTKIDKANISGIIYNIDDFDEFEKTYNSMINQTHEFKEIYLVNIGQNKKKIEEFIKKEKNIELFDSSKDKQANILNKILNNDKSDYISFIQSGDTLDIRRNEIGITKIVCSETVFVHSSYNLNDINNTNMVDMGLKNGFLTPMLVNKFDICYSSAIFDLDYIKKNKIRFNEELKNGFIECLAINVLKDKDVLAIKENLVTKNAQENMSEIYDDVYKEFAFDKYFDNYEDEMYKLTQLKYGKELEEDTALSKDHINELLRYAFMLTKEFRVVSKARNLSRRITFRKEQDTYNINYDDLKYGILNKTYNKLSNIKNRRK